MRTQAAENVSEQTPTNPVGNREENTMQDSLMDEISDTFRDLERVTERATICLFDRLPKLDPARLDKMEEVQKYLAESEPDWRERIISRSALLGEDAQWAVGMDGGRSSDEVDAFREQIGEDMFRTVKAFAFLSKTESLYRSLSLRFGDAIMEGADNAEAGL